MTCESTARPLLLIGLTVQAGPRISRQVQARSGTCQTIPEVTDKEVAAEYAKTKASYDVPAKRDVRHILVKDKATADRLYAQLSSSDASFAALAKQYSTDTGSKVKGGDLGVSSKGSFVPEFDKVAFSIKTGVVSKPVKTQFGWHLIEAVGEIIPATTRLLDAPLTTQIRAQLETRKKQAKLQTWFTRTQSELDSKRPSN